MHSAHTPQPCFNFFLLLHTVHWVQYLGPWKQGEKVFVLELSFNILQGGQMRAPILGWSDFYFFDRTEDGTLPKVRYNFISPNLNFRHVCTQQSFYFQKIPEGLNINIFLWKSAWCFLWHKRTNAEKQIQNLSFKNYYFGPQKKRVLGF